MINFIGQVFEKYHAVNIGYPGGGGEYIVQEGFGWTNGVTEWILNKFGGNLTAPSQCLKIEREVFMNKDEFFHQIKTGTSDSNNSAGTGRITSIVGYVLFKMILFFRFL